MVNKDPISTPPQARRVLTVFSAVPYCAAICEWLSFQPISLDHLVSCSRRYEHAYLAWETVRKVRNPFFVDGTGFEGYFVGQGLSLEEVSEKLIGIGRYMLESNLRLYRFNYSFRARLMKTLVAETNDPQAIGVLAAQFGAALGKVRCNLLTNERARHFQTETYLRTGNLPAIRYTQIEHAIEQRYALPYLNHQVVPQGNLRLEAFAKPSDADAYLVIKSIGKFGHPLIREYLDKRHSSQNTANVF